VSHISSRTLVAFAGITVVIPKKAKVSKRIFETTDGRQGCAKTDIWDWSGKGLANLRDI
jgi:hypothetical protein